MQFSILIPAFNAEDTIAETFDSLLNQIEPASFEIIVVDDGSTDHTASIAKRYAVKFEAQELSLKLISQENKGASFALTRAASVAQGDYLIQLGADDKLAPSHLREVSSFIDEHPSYGIYAANAQYFTSEKTSELYHPLLSPYDSVFSLTFEDMLCASGIYGTAAIRRSDFEQVGSLKQHFYNEDYFLWLQLLYAGAKHIYQPKVLSFYRISAGQKTGDALRVRQDDIDILGWFLENKALNETQTQLIKSRIKALKLNLRIRTTLYRIFGSLATEKTIRFLKGKR